MLGIYKSDKRGFKAVLIDLINKRIVADLVNITDGYAQGTQYKRDHGLRCSTLNRSKVLFDGMESIAADFVASSPSSGGTVAAIPERTSIVAKYTVATRFEFMEELINMVIKGTHPACVITGPGGVGKSKTVFDAIHNAGMKPGSYKIMKGKTTPLGLYMLLYENKHSLIVFDDCDSAFEDEASNNLLKAVLDSNDHRFVTWNSSRIPDGLPTEFQFHGRVIFVSNVPIRKFDSALISRSWIIDLQMSRDEIMDRIEQLKMKILPCTKEDADGVFKFIKDRQDEFVELNLRTYLKVLKLKLTGAPKWLEMSEYMFCK